MEILCRCWVSLVCQKKLLLKKLHGPSLHKNALQNHLIEIVIFLLLFTVRYVISLSSVHNIRFLRRSLFNSLYFISVLSYIHYVLLYSLAIKLSGDIEEKPSPKPNSCDCLPISHWNIKQHLCVQLYKTVSSSCLHLYQQN